jgi:hypothetical protein
MKIINEPSIIDYTPVMIRDGEHPNRLVLRKISENEYAIHRENMKIDGNNVEHMSFYWGDYFQDIDSAMEEFNRRRY